MKEPSSCRPPPTAVPHSRFSIRPTPRGSRTRPHRCCRAGSICAPNMSVFCSNACGGMWKRQNSGSGIRAVFIRRSVSFVTAAGRCGAALRSAFTAGRRRRGWTAGRSRSRNPAETAASASNPAPDCWNSGLPRRTAPSPLSPPKPATGKHRRTAYRIRPPFRAAHRMTRGCRSSPSRRWSSLPAVTMPDASCSPGLRFIRLRVRNSGAENRSPNLKTATQRISNRVWNCGNPPRESGRRRSRSRSATCASKPAPRSKSSAAPSSPRRSTGAHLRPIRSSPESGCMRPIRCGSAGITS